MQDTAPSHVLDNLLEGCQIIGFDFRYIYLNEAAAAHGGTTTGELLGRRMDECFPGIEATAMFAVLARCMTERAPARMDNHFALPDGSRRWFSLRFVPVPEGTCVLSLDITEWKMAEERARADEARFRQLADSMPQIVWTATPDGALDYYNQRWFDYTGMTLEETKGWGWGPVLHPDDLQFCIEAWTRSFTTGQPYEIRYRFKRASDGRYRWHLGRALPARDASGTISKWFGTCTDVDDELRAEAALRTSEARFSRLSEAGIIGVLVSSLDGRIVEINDALLEMLGYSREEALSERFHWNALTPPEWRGLDARAIEELRSSSVGGLREKEYLHKDGHRVPVLAGSAMLEGEKAEAISFILDLTERKRAEAAAARLREEHAVEASFRALIEAAPDAMLIAGDADGILIVNAEAERLFGYDRSELLGQPILMLAADRTWTVPEERRVESFRRDPSMGGSVRYELRCRRKDGSEFPAEVSLSPLRTEGRVLTSRSIRDISARKHAEERLRAAEERLRLLVDALTYANRELEAFSYSVAHDLRAPLRGMNGFAQLLLDTYADKLDAEGQEWLHEILVSARKMAELIDALLSLASLARASPRAERLDMSALVHVVASELATQNVERRVEVVIQPSVWAHADPQLARALVTNLLANAWKFTGNTATARIEFGASHERGVTTFFVRDNGAGFDMAFADKLFGPFQRLHAASEFPGTGIGLATVQRIANRHGGRVWAEGSVNGGATFHFTLANPTTIPPGPG